MEAVVDREAEAEKAEAEAEEVAMEAEEVVEVASQPSGGDHDASVLLVRRPAASRHNQSDG